MSTVPSQYPNRNSLRRQSKNQRNPWKASAPATCSIQPAQDLGSGYSGNSDTLSSGSRKYASGPQQAASTIMQHSAGAPVQVVCHQPEPAYENVIGGGRLSLSRYMSSVVPSSSSGVRKSHHHHQGGGGGMLSRGGLGASTPLIEFTTGSRGSTTSPEVANIYDVIEEKSSRSGRGPCRPGGTLSPAGMLHHYANRPMTPVSVKTCGSETGVYACGGHCLPFERVCDKILRVVYGIGVLVGIGLLLAGMNGHQLRQRQNSLMYIGLMVFSVCCLLLWIQCRHYAHRRGRHHRTVRRPANHANLPSPGPMIPMAHFANGTVGRTATYMGGGNYLAGEGTSGYIVGGEGAGGYMGGASGYVGGAIGHAPLMLSHENPLLHRYIEQQSSYTPPPPPASELETHASSLYAQA